MTDQTTPSRATRRVATRLTSAPIRTAETIALLATLVAFAATVVMLEVWPPATEANPLTAALFERGGYLEAATIAVVGLITGFQVLNWGRNHAPRVATAGAAGVALVSVLDAAWTGYLFVTFEHDWFWSGTGQASIGLFAALAVAWIARDLVSATWSSLQSPSRGQARALLFAFVMVSSIAAIPLAVGPGTATAMPTNSLSTATATTDNATIYVGSEDNNLYAYDSETGEKKWTFTTGGSLGRSSPTVVDGTVYVGSTDNNLYAVDAGTGEEEWNFTANDYVTSSPTVVDGTVYVGSGDNNLYAVDAGTGEKQWEYSTSGNIGYSSAQVVDGMVYIGSNDGGVHAVDAGTGQQEWKFTTGGSTYASPTLYKDTLYAASKDNNLYAIDPKTGDEKWRFETGDSIVNSPTIKDDTIYIGSVDGSLYAIDSETGQKEWNYSEGVGQISSSATISNDVVYVGASDGSGGGLVHAVDADTGSRVWTHPTNNNAKATPTVSDGVVYVGEYQFYALDAQTGDTLWSTSANGYDSSATVVESGGDRSAGTRTSLGTLGHHGGWTGSFADSITGTVTDQHGDPVPNATVSVWGTNPPNFDESTLTDLNSTIDDLESQLESPLPDGFDEDLQLTGTGGQLSGADTNVVAVHSESDWDLNGRSIPGSGIEYNIDPDLDQPTVTAPSNERVVLSVWDPTESGGAIRDREDAIDSALPGRTTTGTIVVEQLSPTGETRDMRTLETSPVLTANPSFSFSQKTHEAAVTELPAGVYRVYAEGHKETAYLITVGDPDELIDSITSDVQDQIVSLEDREERLSDLLADDRIVRKTTQADANGAFAVDMPSGVETANVHAMRADGTILEGLSDPGMQDLRDAQAGSYNGTFFLPNPEPNTVEPPAQNVSVTVYRSPKVPLGDMESLATLQQWLENQRLNETIDELRTEYDQRFDEMERQGLERVYSDHRTLVETLPGAEERYLNRSEFNTIQNASNLSSTELPTETQHMQVALTGIGEIEPPDLGGENPIDIGGDGIDLEYPLPDGIDPDSISLERHWSNGSVETIDDEFWSVESAGLTGQGQKVVVNDLPISDADPAAFDIRVRGASTGDGGLLPDLGDDPEGLLDDRLSALNPAASGSAPGIDAVDFSSLAPGPSERVNVGIDATDGTGYGSLVDAAAFAPDGTELNATIDPDRDRASFRTDGAGTHSVRLTYENQQGEQFTVSERIDAKEQSRSDPATVRASGSEQSLTGIYAVTGENLEGARLKSNGGTMDVTVVADDSDGPGELNVMPSNAMTGTEHTIDISVVYGSDEQRVSGNIPVNIHLENTRATTLYWRSAADFGGDPITHSGETRFGSVEKPTDGKHVVRTYTEPDGSLTVTAIESAGYLDRASHQASQWLSGLPIPFGMTVPSGEFVGVLGLAGIAVHRRRRDTQ
ncbi:PQQ-binding-like beta-propeller repeat protein [Natrinema pallidum]